MVKFRPIAYGENDLRAFRYMDSADTNEGVFAYVAGASMNMINVRLADVGPQYWQNATKNATRMVATSVKQALLAGKYFPIYREDPDIENVSATIKHSDMVIGFFGQECEVYYDALEPKAAASWSAGVYVVLASSGKMTYPGGQYDTPYIWGMCLGTQNGWVRMQVL